MNEAATQGIFGGPIDETRCTAYWNSMAPSYAEGAVEGIVRFTHQLQHAAVLRLAKPSPGDRVLDAGAGAGLLTRKLVEAGCEVTAADSSPAMVAELRGVTPSVVLAKLEELDLGEATFDVVLAVGVLNFVSDPREVLRRLCKQLSPGGTLVLQVTEWSFFGLLYRLNYLLRGFHPFLFTKRWLVSQAAQYGLRFAGYEHPLPHDLTIAFKRPNEPALARADGSKAVGREPEQ